MAILNIKNEVLVRVYLVAAAVLAVAIVIAMRLYQISQVQGDYWAERAQKRLFTWVDVRADRGNILADDGSLLATSLPYFDIYFDAHSDGLTDDNFYQNVDSLALLLSNLVKPEFTPGAYRDWMVGMRQADRNTKGVRYAEIAKNVPFHKMLQIKDFPLFRLGKTKGGIVIEQKPKRERPFKILAQRTIGYVREGALPVGLEGKYDNVLGGSLGKQLMQRVPGDMYIPVHDLAEIEPKSGDDIVTTLDVNIQDAAENALIDAVRRHNADHGCAIVMETKTGAIRAMANIGRTPEGLWETFNYAVGQRVEPGSMFKLASFMAMLEDGYIDDLNAQVPVFKGKTKFYKDELVDAEPHGRDTMTVREVFAHSSNVGTATMIQRFYGEKGRAAAFIDNLRDFGLDLPTGVDVEGEDPPYIKTPDDAKADWSGTTLPWMSIGYEMLYTPLQLLQFYNAVANDGRMMKPYLVQRIEHYGETVQEFAPVVLKRSIAGRKTLKKARELLEAVVQEGTAKNINPKHFRIAGKTGTAQLNYHKFKAQAGIRHQAGFCGYFPAENPEYSCIVVISEPKQGGYHGSEVAAPVFRKIADKCFAMKADLHPPLNQAPKPKFATAQMPTVDAGAYDDFKKSMKWLRLDWREKEKGARDWVMIKAQNDTLHLLNRIVPDKTIPSVTGMGLKDAIYLLENRGCRVRALGVGKIVKQSMPPGSRANGQTITLWLE